MRRAAGDGNNENEEADFGPIHNSNPKTKHTSLINFDNIEDENIERIPHLTELGDTYKSAAGFFLRDYCKKVKIRNKDKKTHTIKKAYLYRDFIKALTNKGLDEIKIINIDYEDFADWLEQCFRNMDGICVRHSFEYPIVDLDKLEDYEKVELAVYMYSKKLFEYLTKDRVEDFTNILKDAALDLLVNYHGFDLELDLKNSKDKELTKSFLRLHIGLKNFPNLRDIHEIKEEHLNKAVVIKGNLVSYDDKVRVEVLRSWWKCPIGDCLYEFAVQGTNRPTKCHACGEKSDFIDMGRTENMNYSYMKIQQHMNSSESQIGVTDLMVKIEGSYLTDFFYKKMKPAANLKVTGIVKLSQERQNRNNPNERLLQLHALTIEIEGENTVIQYNDKLLDVSATRVNQQYIDAHVDKMIRSMVPHIFGLEPIKTAALLMCVGAEPRVNHFSKNRIRGDIIMLLAGDAGTGKTEVGLFLLKIMPMSIRTIGGKAQTTKAALTTSADMINGVRVVTYGVLPLCDLRGIAIIDELDKRDKEDFETLSVPMDDNQVIPTHKSGFHHDVFARCPILLSGNATKKHGKWDVTKTIDEQTNYARWLLSRVDLVFVLVDDGDMKKKAQMVEHIAKSRSQMVMESDFDKTYKNKLYSDVSIEKVENDLMNNRFDGIYDTEYLRHEVHFLKQNYKPLLQPGSKAVELLNKEYLRFSSLTVINDYGDGEGPVSQAVMDARAYNGIERLAMAFARLYRSHVVTEVHVQKALNLMLASLTSLMPQQKQDPDKVNSGDIRTQFNRILTQKDGFAKINDALNAGWNKKRDKYARELRIKLTKFNQMLFYKGFYNCAECHGQGYINIESGTKSETCVVCKGNKQFKRKFTFYDFQADVVNSKMMAEHEVTTWFTLYSKKGLVKPVSGNVWTMGFDKIDSIYISDFVDEIANATADAEIEKQKQIYSGGVDNIGPVMASDL